MGPLKVLSAWYIQRIETHNAPNAPILGWQAILRRDGRIVGPVRDTYDEADKDGARLVAKVGPDPVTTH